MRNRLYGIDLSFRFASMGIKLYRKNLIIVFMEMLTS